VPHTCEEESDVGARTYCRPSLCLGDSLLWMLSALATQSSTERELRRPWPKDKTEETKIRMRYVPPYKNEERKILFRPWLPRAAFDFLAATPVFGCCARFRLSHDFRFFWLPLFAF
jgi:hypothetical protein